MPQAPFAGAVLGVPDAAGHAAARRFVKQLSVFRSRLLSTDARSPTIFLARPTKAKHLDIYWSKAVATSLLTKATKAPVEIPLLGDREEGVDADKHRASLAAIARTSQACLEESGVQPLHLGICWVEGRLDEKTFVRAPLLLIPGELQLKTGGRTSGWYLSVKDDAPLLNTALVALIKECTGYELPADIEERLQALLAEEKDEIEGWRKLRAELAERQFPAHDVLGSPAPFPGTSKKAAMEKPGGAVHRQRSGARRVGRDRRKRHRPTARLHVDLVERVRVARELGHRFEHHMVLIERFVDRRRLGLGKLVVQNIIDVRRRDGEPGRSQSIERDVSLEPAQRAAELRLDFEDDVVLMGLRVEGRHLALTERVVERVVERLRSHAEARRGHAIDVERKRIPIRLLIGDDVLQLRELLELSDELARPGRELDRVRIFERVLELRAAHAILDREILHRLQVSAYPLNRLHLRAQTKDDVARRAVALGARLEIDLQPPAVERRVRAVDADE